MTTISQIFLTFLLNALWQIALITLVAIICAKLLHKASARYGYVLWVAALSLSLFLPVLTSSQFSFRDFFNRLTMRQVSNENPAVREITLPVTEPLVSLEPGADAAPFTIPIGPNLAIALIILYFLFVSYRGAKLLKAWLRTRAIARGAYQVPLPESVQTAVKRCQSVIGVEKVSVLCSNAVPVPVTIGNRNPLVILPEQLLQERDTNLLITAIGHELVHVRRRDYIFNLIFEVICLLLSFHPAAMLMKRRISQTRELCCDEIVAKRLLSAEVYARSLVTIAGSASFSRRLAPTTTVGITDAENLEVRIMSLLKKSELSLYKKSLLIIAAILLIAVPCIAAAVFTLSVGVKDVNAQQNERQENKQKREVRAEDELRERLRDPKLSQEEREQIGRELKEREERQFTEKLNDPRTSPEERERMEVELKSRKERMDRERLAENLTPEQREKRQHEEMERMRFEREQQAKLAKEAKIPMDQAIQAATNTQPGTVLQCKLERERDTVIYIVLILDKDSAKGSATFVEVSAVNGQVLGTRKRDDVVLTVGGRTVRPQ